MKKLILVTWTAITCIFASGCASIVDGGSKSVYINSTPSGAKFTIYNQKGKVVETTNTPASVTLDRSGGYFCGTEYRLVFEAPGYYPGETKFTSSLNGWYFGNIGFGGLIGFLIVDPATGAMFTLPHDFNYNLVPSNPPLSPEELKDAQLKANPSKEKPPSQAKQK